ncbi:hypothetical protein AB834_05670 [PVC group bacterium (ex Bugula neritina AB1)]|nr:hypothetical protein AB834_05670 [PVC group bacterium (ex Bugula neritina AB1)]
MIRVHCKIADVFSLFFFKKLCDLKKKIVSAKCRNASLKSHAFLRLLPLFSFVSFFLYSSVLVSGVIDGVEAVVNDHIITTDEINQVFLPQKEVYEKRFKGDNLRARLVEARQMILEKMIEHILVYEDALKKNIKISSKEIDKAIERLQQKFETKSAFMKSLRDQGMSEKSLRESVKKTLYFSRYNDYFVRSTVRVLDSEIDEYYKANKNVYTSPQEFRVSQIFIPFKKSQNKDTAQQTISKAMDLLSEGKSFESVAKEYSQGPNASAGGDLGFMKSGQIIQALEKSLTNLSIGETTGIIESSQGLHILRLTARKQAAPIPFPKVKKHIQKQLFIQKSEKKYRKIIKKLREKSYIEYKTRLE